jgi:hypothetical protein
MPRKGDYIKGMPIFARVATRRVLIVLVGLMMAPFSRPAVAQTSFDINLVPPAAAASACVPSLIDPNGSITDPQNRTIKCETQVSSLTLKGIFASKEPRNLDTGLLIGPLLGSGFTGINTAQASAGPFQVNSYAAAASERNGAGFANSFVIVKLMDKTTNKPKGGTLKVTIIASAKAKKGHDGAAWDLVVGEMFCEFAEGVSIDKQTLEVSSQLDYAPCAPVGVPDPIYARAAGNVDPTQPPPVIESTGVQIYQCDAASVPLRACPLLREETSKSATFSETIGPMNVPLGIALVRVDATAVGNAAAAIDPVFSSDDPDVTVVVTGLEGPAPAPFTGFDKILTDLEAQGLDLSDFKAVGLQPSATSPTLATTAAAIPAANSSGWNNTSVTAFLNASDPGGPGVKALNFSLSGAQTGTGTIPGASGSVTINAEGTTTLTYFAQDTAGNQETPKTLVARIDGTPPTITSSRTPAANSFGWNNTDVTVSFACADALSGIDTCGPSPQIVTSEGLNQSRSGTAVDFAGNSATAVVGNLNIDKTPPSISCTANPSVLWPPNNKLVSVTVSVSLSDSLSGPAGFTLVSATSNEPDSGLGDIQGFAPGTASTSGQLRAQRLGSGNGRVYTLTYNGTDRAGNSATCSTTVSVPHDQGN